MGNVPFRFHSFPPIAMKLAQNVAFKSHPFIFGQPEKLLECGCIHRGGEKYAI